MFLPCGAPDDDVMDGAHTLVSIKGLMNGTVEHPRDWGNSKWHLAKNICQMECWTSSTPCNPHREESCITGFASSDNWISYFTDRHPRPSKMSLYSLTRPSRPSKMSLYSLTRPSSPMSSTASLLITWILFSKPRHPHAVNPSNGWLASETTTKSKLLVLPWHVISARHTPTVGIGCLLQAWSFTGLLKILDLLLSCLKSFNCETFTWVPVSSLKGIRKPLTISGAILNEKPYLIWQSPNYENIYLFSVSLCVLSHSHPTEGL